MCSIFCNFFLGQLNCYKTCICFGFAIKERSSWNLNRKQPRLTFDVNAILKGKLLNTLLLECVRCTFRFLYRFSDLLEMLWGYCCFLHFFLIGFDFIIFGFSKSSKFVSILKMHFDRDINRKNSPTLYCSVVHFIFDRFSFWKTMFYQLNIWRFFFNFVWWKETWDLTHTLTLL